MSSSSAGRHRDSVWDHFIADSSNPAVPKAKCKGCSLVMGAIVARMKKHQASCSALYFVGEEPAPLSSSSLPSSSSEPAKKRFRQTPLEAIRTPEELQHKLDLLLCRFVVSTNSPFSLVDDPAFREFCQALRPGVKLAGRKLVAGASIGSRRQKLKVDFRGLFKTQSRLSAFSKTQSRLSTKLSPCCRQNKFVDFQTGPEVAFSEGNAKSIVRNFQNPKSTFDPILDCFQIKVDCRKF